MKTIYLLINSLMVFMATVTNSYAANDTTIYKSGLLVIVFLGFCALVVIAQLVPALLVLTGMIKSIIKGTKEKSVQVEAGK